MGNSSSQVEQGPERSNGQTMSSKASLPSPRLAKMDESDALAAAQLHAEGRAGGRAELAHAGITIKQEPKRTPRSAKHGFKDTSALATPDATSGSDQAATSTGKRAFKSGKLPKIRKNRTPESRPLSYAPDSPAADDDDVVIPDTQLEDSWAGSPSSVQLPSQVIPASSMVMDKGKDRHKRHKKKRKTLAEVTVDLSDPVLGDAEDQAMPDATTGAHEAADASAGSKRRRKTDRRSETAPEGRMGSVEAQAHDGRGDATMQGVEVGATQQKKHKRKRKSSEVEESVSVLVPATQYQGNQTEGSGEGVRRASKKRKQSRKSRPDGALELDERQDVLGEDTTTGRPAAAETVEALNRSPKRKKEKSKSKKGKKAKPPRESRESVKEATYEDHANDEPILPSALLRTLKSKKSKQNKTERGGGVPLDDTHSAYDDSVASQIGAAADTKVDVQPSRDADVPHGVSRGRKATAPPAYANEIGEEPILGHDQDQTFENDQESTSEFEQEQVTEGEEEQISEDEMAIHKLEAKKKHKKSKSAHVSETTPVLHKNCGRPSRTNRPTPRAKAVRGAQFELDNEQPLSPPPDLRDRGEFSKDEAELLRRKIQEQQHKHDLDVADLVRLIQWTKPYGRARTENDTNEPGDVHEKAQSEASTAFWTEIYDVLPKRKGAKAKGGTTAIQRFVRRKYHNWTKGHGKWDEEEDELLRQLYAAHPGSWKRISQELGDRAEDACRDRWRDYVQYGQKRKTSRWSVEEEERLVQVVNQALAKIRHQVPPPADITSKDISWPWVSQQMGGTRSRVQCFMKWKGLEEQKEEDDRYQATKSLVKKPKRKSRRSAAGNNEDVEDASRKARTLGVENMLWGDKLAVIAGFLEVDNAEGIDWDNVVEIAKTESGTAWPQETCRAALDEMLDEVGQQPSFGEAIMAVIDWLNQYHGGDLGQYHASNVAQAEASTSKRKAKTSRKSKSGKSQTPARRVTSNFYVTASDDED
ncbi:hypothetical protein K491DRAFT_720242 [Lophiostoma macrostomum CBS 122681]|uniref:DNA-binding protein REB1 n=1 Tax=Lophiostoma macrostomum CBS 122681 TaxID=1314788 RepID=A0A6A6SWL3_9PLEO|nr:hypothetical protein K491DRAFT_720242 [Lophiostoma macrostomum CBS 122681]